MARASTKKSQNDSANSDNFKKRLIRNLIWSFLFIIVLILIFIVIPIVSRNYFVQSLKISESIFVSAPERINLVKKSEVGVCYPVKINGYTFSIPDKFTPVKIGYNAAEFRIHSRVESRHIYIYAEEKTKKVNFKSSGISRWFLPSEMRKLLPLVLNSDWHPIRLMFKYQIYATEGINSKIFQTKWNENHVGFIFPSSGNEGYLGRIFRMDGDGTVDILISDTVRPVTLTDWVDIAMKLETPKKGEPKSTNKSKEKSEYNLDELIEQILKTGNPSIQRKTLSIGLEEYFRTKQPEWLIPVAIVMQKRGFYPDVLDMIQQFRKNFKADSKYLSKWNDLVDKSVSECLDIEIDPVSDLKDLNIYCKNKTNLDIDLVTLDIEISSNFGNKQNFTTTLFTQTTLRSKEEKRIKVKCPHDFNLADATTLAHRVTELNFVE